MSKFGRNIVQYSHMEIEEFLSKKWRNLSQSHVSFEFLVYPAASENSSTLQPLKAHYYNPQGYAQKNEILMAEFCKCEM
jgi:hypothetical protein